MHSPLGRGFVPPAVIAAPSGAAPLSRAMAIAAGPKSHMLPVFPRRLVDQRNVLCCVSCALGGAMEVVNPHWPALAPLFHYHVTRFINGKAGADGGLTILDGLETLTNQGICRAGDHAHPFTDAGSRIAPTAAASKDARTRQITRDGLLFRMERIGRTARSATLRNHLGRDRAVVIGFRLPFGYPASISGNGNIWRDPDTPPPSASNHCVLLVGFNDLHQAVRVADSQGEQAFENGCWWMGYRVLDSDRVLDAYTLT